jgi:hypothetical protein
MSDKKSPIIDNPPKEHGYSGNNVTYLEEYRNKQAAQTVGEPADKPGTWERTSLALFPAREGTPVDGESVRIVKVSSGFGKLRIPAWEDTIRCMAA